MKTEDFLTGNCQETVDLALALGISDPENVTRFVLDVEVGEIAKLYVERRADRRGLQVLKALAPRVKVTQSSPQKPAEAEQVGTNA